MDFEAMLETFYRKLDLRAGLVVDVGAHTGRHAFPFAEMVGTDGAVYAFEPIPEIRKNLVDEMVARSVNNIVLLPFALSYESGTSEFTYIPDCPQESGLRERHIYNVAPERIVKRTVCVRRLDDLVPETQRVSFIKIDVEGGELSVLRGCTAVLEKSRPIVTFECGASGYLGYHNTPEEIFNIFNKLDYRVYSITGTHIRNASEFANYSVEQSFWDYLALPSEKQDVARLIR